jgi:VanZ family protein
MRIAVALYAGLLLAIVALADLGVLSGLVTWMHEVPLADKVAHFAFALGLGALSARASDRFVALGPVTLPRGVLWVAPVVLLEELSQLFVRGRTFDLLDLVADALGVGLGTWLAGPRSPVAGASRAPRGCMRV